MKGNRQLVIGNVLVLGRIFDCVPIHQFPILILVYDGCSKKLSINKNRSESKCRENCKQRNRGYKILLVTVRTALTLS